MIAASQGRKPWGGELGNEALITELWILVFDEMQSPEINLSELLFFWSFENSSFNIIRLYESVALSIFNLNTQLLNKSFRGFLFLL